MSTGFWGGVSLLFHYNSIWKCFILAFDKVKCKLEMVALCSDNCLPIMKFYVELNLNSQ